jgi:hypothetical protein
VDQFIKHFIRNADGSWQCVSQALLPGPPVIVVSPGSRFAQGTMIAGVDVAALLEAEYQRGYEQQYGKAWHEPRSRP